MCSMHVSFSREENVNLVVQQKNYRKFIIVLWKDEC